MKKRWWWIECTLCPYLHDIFEWGRTVRRFKEEKVRVSFIEEMRLHGGRGLFELICPGVDVDGGNQSPLYCTYNSGSLQGQNIPPS